MVDEGSPRTSVDGQIAFGFGCENDHAAWTRGGSGSKRGICGDEIDADVPVWLVMLLLLRLLLWDNDDGGGRGADGELRLFSCNFKVDNAEVVGER